MFVSPRPAALILVLTGALWIAPARADVKQVSLGIKGATCATCAFALRKAFKRLDGVDDARLTTKLASMDVKVKPGVWPDFPRMQRMIRDTGFEAVANQVRVVATGTLAKQSDGWTLTLVDMKTPTTLVLVLAGETAPTSEFVDLQVGHLVEVDGTWRAPLQGKPGAGTLRVATLRRVPSGSGDASRAGG